jgi:branched-chain amino acid aminotransferase
VKFVFLNGQVVPTESATIPISDRSFLYGDGLFETLRVTRGQPQLWDEHWKRFSRGAEFLRIALACDSKALRKRAEELFEANETADCVLRIHLSRGVGPRGYSPRGAESPVLIMSTHALPPPPESWELATTSFRLPATNPLSAFKTTSRLLHVMARTEVEDKRADEGILLTDAGEAAQGTSSNLFWIEGETICTAPEQSGILPGVTRGAVLRACERLKLTLRQSTTRPEALRSSSGIFMTLSTYGLVEAASLDGHALARSPLVPIIQNAFNSLLFFSGGGGKMT